MRKQALIHLHDLLVEAAAEYAEREEEPDTPRYDAMEARPTDIHRSKTEHRYAVFALATDLGTELTGDGSDLLAERVDSYLEGDEEETTTAPDGGRRRSDDGCEMEAPRGSRR